MPFEGEGPSKKDFVSQAVTHPGGGESRGRTAPYPPTEPGERQDTPPVTTRKRKPWQRAVAWASLPVAGVASWVGLSRMTGDPTPRVEGNTGTTLVVPVPETSIVAPSTTEAPTQAQLEQKKVDDYLDRAGYPELKGRMPTFRHDIETGDANIHVLSFLSPGTLPEGSFNKEAYKATVEYLEKLAKEKVTLTWNSRKEGGQPVSRTFVSNRTGDKKLENFVILTDDEPTPQRLEGLKYQFPLLKQQMEAGTTYLFTGDNGGSGSTSYLRYSEFDTWKAGTSTADNRPLTVAEQINLGLILEAVPAVGTLDPYDFNAVEGFKNTLGGLGIGLVQNDQPISLAERRFGRAISPTSPNVYLPDSAQLREIFANAPRTPAVAA